jgi:hypothetical protein
MGVAMERRGGAAVVCGRGRHAQIGSAATTAEQAVAELASIGFGGRVPYFLTSWTQESPGCPGLFHFPRCPGGSQRVPNGCQRRVSGSASDS